MLKETLKIKRPINIESINLTIWLKVIDNDPSVKGMVTEAIITTPNKLRKVTVEKIPISKSEIFKFLWNSPKRIL